MIDEENALVRVKFYLSSPNGVDSNGKPIGRRTLEYLVDPNVVLEMINDVRNGITNCTLCAKRFSHGSWIDVCDTIILDNVSWVEWPMSILEEDDDSE